MFIAIFLQNSEYGQSGYIFAHISMTTRARDFKFAGAIVQRLLLVMVALTQNIFQRIMHGFLVDGHKCDDPLKKFVDSMPCNLSVTCIVSLASI